MRTVHDMTSHAPEKAHKTQRPDPPKKLKLVYWYVLNCQLISGSATLSIELRTLNFLANSG